MITIRFITEYFAPGQTVAMRWGPNWDLDRGGVYVDGAWTFYLDEAAFPGGIDFTFVLTPGRWHKAGGRRLEPWQFAAPFDVDGDAGYDPADPATSPFQPADEAIVENPAVAQRFFTRNLSPDKEWDVIVVGSGMGGGVLASRLAALGAEVLVLEVGSYLFPTHIANLPRRLKTGRFDKHVWSLWDDFKVVNHVPGPGSQFVGAQGFNLGGRSLFWGGLVPRQVSWELAAWPEAVRDHLLQGGFAAAEAFMGAVPPDPDPYQAASRQALQAAFPGFVAEDARVAVQYEGATELALGAGLFSTADLLMQGRLVDDDAYVKPTVNLNTAVWRVVADPADPRRVTGVVGWDLLGRRQREFTAKTVVLSAGTIESAKIALQSGLADPNGLIGTGITDHTIRYRHFTLPPGSPFASTTQSAKVALRHPQATVDDHAFLAVVELGANFNQGRYIDPEHLRREREARGDWMLGELVFLHYADLNPAGLVVATGDPGVKAQVTVTPVPPPPGVLAETDALAADLFAAWGAQPVLGEEGWPGLQTAGLGGVAHEVGTLRMAGDGTGVVDDDLRFLAYDNLYACDNSVFQASPAANPSLTTTALALRLAAHLTA